MEKKIVTFKGITNVPDDGFNEAGDMAVLMNMRHKGGELVPCQPPTETPGFKGVEQVLYHANSGLWLFLEDGCLHYFEDNDWSDGALYIYQSGVESFAIMGNIVIMNFADRVEYAIWRNGGYEYLGALPEVPEMKIEYEATVIKTSAGDGYYNYTAFSQSNDSKWPLFSKGAFDKCLDECYNNKLYIDNALFIVGLKLFDGSYKYSQLYLIDTNYVSNIPANFKTIALKRPENWGGGTSAQMEVEIYGKKVGFIMNYDLSLWKDVILSVDIFTSGSIMSHKVTREKLYVYEYDSTQETGIKTKYISDAEIYTPKSMSEIRREIENCSCFYKIESYDLKGVFIDGVDNTSPSNLSVQPRLPVNNVNLVIGGHSLTFNNRLHVFQPSVIPVFSSNNGYFIKEVEGVEKNTSIKVGEDVYVGKIKIPKEQQYFTQIVSHPKQGVEKQIIEGLYEFDFVDNPFMDMSIALGCKKKRDYLVTIKSVTMVGTLFEDENSNNDYYVNFDIDTFLNKIENKVGDYTLYGTYNSQEFVVVDGVVKKESLSDYGINLSTTSTVVYQGQRFYITVRKQKTCYDISRFEGMESVEAIEDKNSVVNKTNILKVSAVDNPFYFPTAQTYKFEGEIVGLASNAEAISTGQFGQYPLFVFTDTGIWAMGVDTSGQGAYTTQSPFSREVCNGAICPVSGGVVFSTDKGVMVISGGQVADLSAALDGFEVDFFKYNAEMWNAIFAKAGKGVVNPVPIREYIKGAVLAYNYHYNEIILSNKARGYSYVYSLTNQVWSVIDTVFDLTTNKYPELVVFNKGEGCMYTFKDGAALNKVVAITRPFTLGSIDFKRLRQAGLRTTFNGRLNFYVLGSIDGAVFKCITGKEVDADVANPNGGTYRDLITAMSRSKQYKYFAIAIAGRMSGRVSMAELLVDMGFANNQIR